MANDPPDTNGEPLGPTAVRTALPPSARPPSTVTAEPETGGIRRRPQSQQFSPFERFPRSVTVQIQSVSPKIGLLPIHRPFVKSGKLTGRLPVATERSESGEIAIQLAVS